jgi:hypothetical protein
MLPDGLRVHARPDRALHHLHEEGLMAPPFPPHPGTGPVPSAAQVAWLADQGLAFHLISAHADPMAIGRAPADSASS